MARISPRVPGPRPSSRSLDRYATAALIRSGENSGTGSAARADSAATPKNRTRQRFMTKSLIRQDGRRGRSLWHYAKTPMLGFGFVPSPSTGEGEGGGR